MAKYVIYWEWKEGNCKKEQVDTASTEKEANYLVGEYWLAFGRKGRVWWEKKGK